MKFLPWMSSFLKGIPQMAPMYWFLLNMMSISTMFIVMVKLFYTSTN